MAIWRVEVDQIVRRKKVIEVEAMDAGDANAFALAQAGEHDDYRTYDTEYKVNHTPEMVDTY